MAEIVRIVTNRGALLTGPPRPPEVTVWRLPDWTIVLADAPMANRTRGTWSLTFVTGGLDHFYQIDADPAGTGQVSKGERYYGQGLNGVQDEIIEVTVPLLPAAVWLFDLSAGFDSGVDLAGEQLVLSRQFATNRIDAAPGDPGSLAWFNDDKLTVRFTLPLRDYTGDAVVGVAGVPARRGHVVP